MKRILIISHDKVGPSMAGPGIRYHQIASLLSNSFDVTLATFNPAYLEGLSGVNYKFKDIKVFDFKRTFDEFDVILALWLSPEMIDYAKSKNKLLIFDLYAPVPVENLVSKLFSGKLPLPEDDYNYSVSLESYRNFFQVGDFFMCSNSTQKDFWTGYGFASGGITPSSYSSFPLYDRLGVCAMGINLDELRTVSAIKPLRTRFPQIKTNDIILLWTGGIWDWFDAETPIRAIKQLRDEGKTNVKLVFLGTRHPNTDVPEMGETEKAFKLAADLKLLDNSVFFIPGWLAYNDRLPYLLEADAAIYAHKPSIESRFSHRTRVLDHILASLPTIATEGDYFADLIQDHELGFSAPPLDVPAMASAITKLLDKETTNRIRKNITNIQPVFTWQATLEPLIEFLESDAQPRKTVVLPKQVVNQNTKFTLLIKRLLPRKFKELIKRFLMKTS